MPEIGFDQALDQLVAQIPLTDQRMGEERLARDGRVACQCRLDGEALV
jgi:hypothetical protein